MPDDNPDKLWDEYDWERFLQDQELRTEKYMGLIEKYMDHPDRDEIIAREMGWTHMINPIACATRAEAATYPIRHPVTENVLEKPLIVMVTSGLSDAMETCSRPS